MPNLLSNVPAIRLDRRHNAAGKIVTTAGSEHLVVLHESRATWTICRETGARHLRRRGMADLIPAGEIGGYEAESDCESVVLALAPRVLERSIELARGSAGSWQLQPRHMFDNPRIVHLARALLEAPVQEARREDLFLDAVAQALASQLTGLASASPERIGVPQRQVQRVLDLIETHLDSRLTIDVMAREAGASSSHLRHWFQHLAGTSLHRYVMQRRVARARTLLERGELPRAEVALAAGFAHQSHMARWLRREAGRGPLDIRKGR